MLVRMFGEVGLSEVELIFLLLKHDSISYNCLMKYRVKEKLNYIVHSRL